MKISKLTCVKNNCAGFGSPRDPHPAPEPESCAQVSAAFHLRNGRPDMSRSRPGCRLRSDDSPSVGRRRTWPPPSRPPPSSAQSANRRCATPSHAPTDTATKRPRSSAGSPPTTRAQSPGQSLPAPPSRATTRSATRSTNFKHVPRHAVTFDEQPFEEMWLEPKAKGSEPSLC